MDTRDEQAVDQAQSDGLTRHLNRQAPPTQAGASEQHRFEAIRMAVRPILSRELGGLRGTAERPHLTQVAQEVWLKLEKSGPWKNRAHFLAVASLAARQVLIDEARRRQRRIETRPLNGEIADPCDAADQALRLEDLLGELSQTDPEAARVAGFKVFGGLSTATIAEAEGLSTRTVERHWQFARAWLQRRIQRGG